MDDCMDDCMEELSWRSAQLASRTMANRHAIDLTYFISGISFSSIDEHVA